MAEESITCDELYARWKQLGGEMVDGDYVHPIEFVKEFPEVEFDLLEAMLDGGLARELHREGLG